MDYLDHIQRLMIRYHVTGYYHKDNSDLIGFHDKGGIAWYRKNGDKAPIKLDRGTPEQEFNRLHDARFNKLKKST